MTTIHCGECKYRDEQGECTNDKFYEEGTRPDGKEHQPDHLVYSYHEGGGFWVGEKFGCVHAEREMSTNESGFYDLGKGRLG